MEPLYPGKDVITKFVKHITSQERDVDAFIRHECGISKTVQQGEHEQNEMYKRWFDQCVKARSQRLRDYTKFCDTICNDASLRSVGEGEATVQDIQPVPAPKTIPDEIKIDSNDAYAQKKPDDTDDDKEAEEALKAATQLLNQVNASTITTTNTTTTTTTPAVATPTTITTTTTTTTTNTTPTTTTTDKPTRSLLDKLLFRKHAVETKAIPPPPAVVVVSIPDTTIVDDVKIAPDPPVTPPVKPPPTVAPNAPMKKKKKKEDTERQQRIAKEMRAQLQKRVKEEREAVIFSTPSLSMSVVTTVPVATPPVQTVPVTTVPVVKTIPDTSHMKTREETEDKAFVESFHKEMMYRLMHPPRIPSIPYHLLRRSHAHKHHHNRKHHHHHHQQHQHNTRHINDQSYSSYSTVVYQPMEINTAVPIQAKDEEVVVVAPVDVKEAEAVVPVVVYEEIMAVADSVPLSLDDIGDLIGLHIDTSTSKPDQQDTEIAELTDATEALTIQSKPVPDVQPTLVPVYTPVTVPDSKPVDVPDEQPVSIVSGNNGGGEVKIATIPQPEEKDEISDQYLEYITQHKQKHQQTHHMSDMHNNRPTFYRPWAGLKLIQEAHRQREQAKQLEVFLKGL